MLPGEKKYPHIFSPGKLGKLETKNRIKYASTETNFNYRDGYVADKEVAYMEAQARGGAGIVTTQGAYTDARGEGKGYVGMMAIWDDKFIPGLKRIADEIRKYSVFYSHHHNRGYYPEIDRGLVLHDALRIVDYGNVPYNADDTMESIQGCMARVSEIVSAGAR